MVSKAVLIGAALHLIGSPTFAQAPQTATPKADSRTSKLGHHEIKPAGLPPAKVVQAPPNFPRVVPRPAGAELNLPPGFRIDLYVEGGFQRPRWAVQAANGDVFVSDDRAGNLTVLRDANGDGKVDERFEFATGLMQPFGMAFWRDYLYVGNTNAVVRFKYKPGQTKADGPAEKIADLPGTGYREHWTRNLAFSPDGSKLYVSVGSQTNVDPEGNPMRAAISEYNPDGTGHRIFASGTRNPIGLAFYPGSRTLWAAVQERDLLGDDLVPDYVTSIKEGGFYGWPYSYIGPNEDPRRKGEQPELVKKAIVPDVLIQAHSAVLGLAFYTGSMFPAEYRGNAFVALHGSWNRTKRTGYKIIRIRFQNGKPVGGYDDFITGWAPSEESREVWGRPVGVLVLKDGSMLVVDDGANKLWRVTYSKGK
jgi:glucose/arabinose dehydrogenase